MSYLSTSRPFLRHIIKRAYSTKTGELEAKSSCFNPEITPTFSNDMVSKETLDRFHSHVGNRDAVGYGHNGKLIYNESMEFPYPSIRFGQNTPDVMALRGKEKEDWSTLSIEDKKACPLKLALKAMSYLAKYFLNINLHQSGMPFGHLEVLNCPDENKDFARWDMAFKANFNGPEDSWMYRHSFCNTFAEQRAPTGHWKDYVTSYLVITGLSLMISLYMNDYGLPYMPITYTKDWQMAVQRRRLLLAHDDMDYHKGYNYDTNKWEK